MTSNEPVPVWGRAPRRAVRDPLDGPSTADVVIVGGGFTGLWTAHHLSRRSTSRRIVVLEAEHVGFGASGRNGGWLFPGVPGNPHTFERSRGPGSAEAMEEAIVAAYRDVVTTIEANELDVDLVEGGQLSVATNRAQLRRLRDQVAASSRSRLVELDGDSLSARVRVDGAIGATFDPLGASVHPLELVTGLADLVAHAGVVVHERSRATSIEPGRVLTERGSVDAPVIVRATESYTGQFRDHRRTWMPLTSSMLLTAPLPDAAWDEIGWDRRELLGDGAHAYLYAQRTADGRIALGGRGVEYTFGSRIDPTPTISGGSSDRLRHALHALFPATRSVAIDASWSGTLAVPRDWCGGVGFDRRSGLGWAGGYVGHGVAASNLAGHTLADLIDGEVTGRTQLPWVDHVSRRWEPEPLRWLGVHGLYAAYRHSDRREAAGAPRTPRLGRLADRISRRYD
jgi:glycine/D-amino acid oxidase-like deaminating enzyme